MFAGIPGAQDALGIKNLFAHGTETGDWLNRAHACIVPKAIQRKLNHVCKIRYMPHSNNPHQIKRSTDLKKKISCLCAIDGHSEIMFLESPARQQ